MRVDCVVGPKRPCWSKTPLLAQNALVGLVRCCWPSALLLTQYAGGVTNSISPARPVSSTGPASSGSAAAAVPADDSTLRFLKGHGTQNDFVILPDPAATLELSEDFVAALCDRQRGLGADGLLRVARAAALVDVGALTSLPSAVAPDDWFMDYRNADGSIAEMCGNGVRVFAHYLRVCGLVGGDEFTVGSRAGGRPVIVHSFDDVHADISVQMGPVTLGETSTATVGTQTFRGIAVDVGNPHLACVVDGLTSGGLAAIDFGDSVGIDPTVFPAGANLEVITPPKQDSKKGLSAQMRVFERGVGETRSCGTGLVAAAAAGLRAVGRETGELAIDVPGGQVIVTIGDGKSTLRGPSMLVAEGRLRAGWRHG